MAKRKATTTTAPPEQAAPPPATEQAAPPIAATTAEPGNIPPLSIAADPTEAASRVNLAFDTSRRLMAEGRWFGNIEHVRDQMLLDAKRSGMGKAAAKEWVYAEIDRLYPPLGQNTETATPPRVTPQDGRVQGLGDIPWENLPANASLAAEIAWVQSERLYIVEETASGAVRVRLEKAHEPPPSRAALGWLETSIRAYAKFIDVAAKATSQQQDEQEHVRRERLAIEDMRALLVEMRPVCPHCGGSLM